MGHYLIVNKHNIFKGLEQETVTVVTPVDRLTVHVLSITTMELNQILP